MYSHAGRGICFACLCYHYYHRHKYTNIFVADSCVSAGGDIVAQIPTRGPNIVPRIVYLRPGDFSQHGFSQGCPGCSYAQDGIGPKRNHSEACRRRMEEEIGKDESDTRADKAKERQDHFIAQQHEQHERQGNPRRADVIEPENVDEDMDIAADEDELSDAPKAKTDTRLTSPERKRPLREVQLDMMKNRVLK